MSSVYPRLVQPDNDFVSSRVEVLLIGPWCDREFSCALVDIEETTKWTSKNDIDSAAKFLSECDSPPDLILLLQSLPGDYRQSTIDQLQNLTPLTRIVLVAGSWCEGELRTGKPVEGVIRLYWHELATWWQGAMNKLASDQCPPWSQPIDSTLACRVSHERVHRIISSRSQIALFAESHSVNETFATALLEFGLTTNWVRDISAWRPSRQLRGVLWDGAQLSGKELRHLKVVCQRASEEDVSVVALLDFPRAELVLKARSLGVQAVLGKPYVVSEIVKLFG